MQQPFPEKKVKRGFLRPTRVAISMYYYCQGLCFGSWASRIPTIKAHLHLSDAQLGSILLMLPLGQMTMMPISGRIAAKFGSNQVLRLAIFGYVGSLALLGRVDYAWQMALLLLAFGISGNLCNISLNTQGVQAEKLFRRNIFASFHGIWSLGGFSAALIGLFMLHNQIPPSTHFLIIAGLIICSNFYFQKYLIPRQIRIQEQRKIIFKWPHGILLQLGLIAFCCMSVEGCMFDWTGVYFKQVVEAKEKYISLGYAAFMITMAIGRFLGDRLSSRFGRKRMIFTSGVLIFFGMLLTIIFPYVIPATIGCFLTGFGVSSIIPMVYSTAGKIRRISHSLAIASVAGIGYFGFLMGPPIIGYIAEAIGLQYSFLLIAFSGLAISMMSRKIKMFS